MFSVNLICKKMMIRMGEFDKIMHELVLNWKLRLVASALLTMFGLSFLISTLGGFIMDLSVMDQTIVGVAVFLLMIPIYLIIADLPKIDEYTIASMLNESIPKLNRQAELILKDPGELSEQEKKNREEIKPVLKEEKLYRYLPNRPIVQAIVLMAACLVLTAGAYLYFT